MSRARRLKWIVAAAATTTLAGVAVSFACATLRGDESLASDPVAVTVPVALSSHPVPANTMIGVMVTLGVSEVEGTAWGQPAQGAAVAAARLDWGGTALRLVVEDDRGSERGAANAIRRLAERGVSGIVIATAGPQIAAAVAAARVAQVPVVLPYADLPRGDADAPGAWTFTPTAAEIGAGLRRHLAGFSHPLHIELGGELAPGLGPRETVRPVGTDLEGLAAQVAERTGAASMPVAERRGIDAPAALPEAEPGAPRADVLVMNGPARLMGTMVATLQEKHVTSPIVLAPSALSPQFARSVDEAGGVLSPDLQTFGAAGGDALALKPTSEGRSMSAYLQSLRRLAEDPHGTNLTADMSFADAAPWADSRSHDAVLALVAAVSRARSGDPIRVNQALSTLALVAGDGIAGPPLDFSRAHASSAPVRLLHVTSESLGLRPEAGDSIVPTWFPAPARPTASSATPNASEEG